MNQQELQIFIKKYQLSDKDLANLIGLTPGAVGHWLTGRRSIAKPYGRLIRLFDRHPNLMKDFT